MGAGTGAVMVWEGEEPEVYVPEPVPYCAGTDAISELNISSTYPGCRARGTSRSAVRYGLAASPVPPASPVDGGVLADGPPPRYRISRRFWTSPTQTPVPRGGSGWRVDGGQSTRRWGRRYGTTRSTDSLPSSPSLVGRRPGRRVEGTHPSIHPSIHPSPCHAIDRAPFPSHRMGSRVPFAVAIVFLASDPACPGPLLLFFYHHHHHYYYYYVTDEIRTL